MSEYFAWGDHTYVGAFNTWKNSPGHWRSIVSDQSEDEIAECDIVFGDGREIKKGDIIPGRDIYMVCAHAIYQGDHYWVIVYASKQRPWPDD